jgi:hypothetical protein
MYRLYEGDNDYAVIVYNASYVKNEYVGVDTKYNTLPQFTEVCTLAPPDGYTQPDCDILFSPVNIKFNTRTAITTARNRFDILKCGRYTAKELPASLVINTRVVVHDYCFYSMEIGCSATSYLKTYYDAIKACSISPHCTSIITYRPSENIGRREYFMSFSIPYRCPNAMTTMVWGNSDIMNKWGLI